MSNKFLDLYPKLRRPKIGDTVEMLKRNDHIHMWDIGAIGVVIDIESWVLLNDDKTPCKEYKHYKIYFNPQEDYTIKESGYWWAFEEEFKVIKHA